MRWTVRVMAALLLAGTAAAQSPGAWFAGGFGQWTSFDSKWNLDTGLGNTWGWGARAGAFIAPSWNVEGDGFYTPANSKAGTSFLGSRTNGVGGEVKASAFTARLVHTFPAARRHSFHVGGGGALESFRGATDGRAKTYMLGVNGLAGLNFGLSGVAVRLDGVANYFPSNGVGVDFGLQAGLQLSPDLPLFGSTASSPSVMGAPIVWWDALDVPLPGTVELGSSLQQSRFDHNGGRASPFPKNGLGYGVRIGVFLSDPRWEIEGDGYYSPQNARFNTSAFSTAARPTEANASEFAARLNYNSASDSSLAGRQSQFILGLGGVRTNYKFMGGTGAGNVNETYDYNLGVSGLAGLRFRIANRIALRIDGVADYMPNHKPSANVNVHLRGGLSFLLGGARQAMCTFPGLESVPVLSPKCVAPVVAPVVAPPPPPAPPPQPLALGLETVNPWK